MDQIRILILSNNYNGLYSFRREVIEALIHKGYQIDIVAPMSNRSSFFQEMGCIIHDVDLERRGMNPVKDIKLLSCYIKIIKRLSPRIVLTYTIKPNLYGGFACRLLRVKQIANVTGLGSALENPGYLQLLTSIMYKHGLRCASTVFFQNKTNLEFFIKKKLVNGNARLIPGSGVNLEWHHPQEYSPEGETTFIFIGRLLKEKGIDLYCSAAESLKNKFPSTKFLVMGSCNDQYREMMDSLQRRGIVQYVGRQDDVRPFIGKAHCIVLPSFYPEGMNNVLLESCAACRPVITTDRPGCKEIVDDGETGFIVRQRDLNDLISKMELFISLPFETKRQMGIMARKKVEGAFDRRIVIDSYIKAIEEVV